MMDIIRSKPVKAGINSPFGSGVCNKVVNIIPGVTKNLNVRMRPDDIMLDEVVVKPKREKYSRKNNPAVELMKKVIAHKNNNKLSENDYYQYNKYQKITMSLNDVTPEMLEKACIKDAFPERPDRTL